MARIVMADDGITFDQTALEAGPLGGAETAFLSLAQSFARRGHGVHVRNNCAGPNRAGGIDWAPLSDPWPEICDLYIANRGDKLLTRMAKARRTVFWIHNPARYLLKWRYLWKLWRGRRKLWRGRPPIVFSGAHHQAGYPSWAPSGPRTVIAYGISEIFRTASEPANASAPGGPGPRAVFASNPLRSLDWLLELWAARIHPQRPDAELHLFTGAATYGAAGVKKAGEMAPVLERAKALSGAGVVLREPVSKSRLAAEYAAARVMLYRGDPGETFCLAVGEAQAAGLPCVVQDIGCVAEAALQLLGDDALWRSQSAAAISRQRGWGWDEAVGAFEGLIP